MRVLYIGSNPKSQGTLNLEREITDLQLRAAAHSTDPIQFLFMPDISVEDLPGVLLRHPADVLHLSTHGDGRALILSNASRAQVELTSDMLLELLNFESAPTLVYINACNSNAIAKEVATKLPYAIGCTAPISNRAARAGAVAFYERLLAGADLDRAFGACKGVVRALGRDQVQTTLHARPDMSPRTTTLHQTPTIVAILRNGARPARDKHYSIHLGIVGCPASTTQVVFFTDDATFIGDEDDLEGDLTSVVRETPVGGTLWLDEAERYWRATGDFRIFAAGSIGEGRAFTAATTLCQAIERRFTMKHQRIPQAVARALATLRARDGSEGIY